MNAPFAVRDDDCSYFTNPEQLDQVYGAYWERLPISLAVIPFAVPVHKGRVLGEGFDPARPMPLEENRPLVRYLREKVCKGQVEILLHGHTHEYAQTRAGWQPEYVWKPAERLARETLQGKQYLEQLLNTRIQVFVPPSDRIGAGGVAAVRKAGLNLSGAMGLGGDRPLSWDYCLAYAKRWGTRLLHGTHYPSTLRYGGHAELAAYTLTACVDQADLKSKLMHPRLRDAPFVLATHYWEFAEQVDMGARLAELVDIAQQEGRTFTTVSRCIEPALRMPHAILPTRKWRKTTVY